MLDFVPQNRRLLEVLLFDGFGAAGVKGRLLSHRLAQNRGGQLVALVGFVEGDSAQFGKLRIKADFETRSLTYILQNQPSLVPYQDLPPDAKTTPEIFGSLGFDYFLERIGLTLGATVGVQNPATFTPKGQISGAIIGITVALISVSRAR